MKYLTLLSNRLVVDTSYLYTLENEPNQSPSIRDISEAVLGNTMENVHDSIRDAEAALRAAEYILQTGSAPAVPRSAASLARQSGAALLIHRIPQGFTTETLSEMIVNLCAVIPTSVQNISWSHDSAGNDLGKALVYFPSREHCDLAFEALPGPNRPDKTNKPQKRSYLQGGGYICIRKN